MTRRIALGCGFGSGFLMKKLMVSMMVLGNFGFKNLRNIK